MLQKRLKLDLSVVTDKNHWKKFEEIEAALIRKTREIKEIKEVKQMSSSYRCDTPDKGGGKPDIGEIKRKKNSEPPMQYRSKLATKIIKISYYKIPRKNFRRNESIEAVKQRSTSTKKIHVKDLKKGSFSNKHSASKEKIPIKTSIGKLANNWKAEIRSLSVMKKQPVASKSPEKSPKRKKVPSVTVKIQKDSGYIQPWKKLMRELDANK